MNWNPNVLERLRNGLTVKACDMAAVSGLSRAAFYKAIERGEIEVVTIGRSKLIPAHEGRRLLGLTGGPLIEQGFIPATKAAA